MHPQASSTSRVSPVPQLPAPTNIEDVPATAQQLFPEKAQRRKLPWDRRHIFSTRSSCSHTRLKGAPKNTKSIFSGVGLPRIRPIPLTILLLVGVVLFFVVRHFAYGTRIPVIQKKHEYRVIPPNE